MVGLTLFPLQMIRLTLAHCKIKEISPNKEDLKLPLSNDFFFLSRMYKPLSTAINGCEKYQFDIINRKL